MSYKDAYDKAMEAGKITELTAEYKQWEEKGDLVVGRFIATNAVTSRLGSGEYNQYLFQCDEGLIKFALGAITDAEALPMMEVGKVYAICYQGKDRISGGRQVNRFKVTRVDVDESGVLGDDDEPPF